MTPPIDDGRRGHETASATAGELRVLLDSIPALVSTVTSTGEIDFANRPLLEYLGVGLDELRNWPEFIHEQDRAGVIEGWSEALHGGQPFSADYRLRRSDGEYRWFQGRAVPVRGQDGSIDRWCCVITDIEERKHAEALRRATERREILDNIPTLVAIHSASGEMEMYNRAAQEYHGPCVADPKTWNVSDIIHPDDLPELLIARRRGVRTTRAFDTEPRMRRADGTYRYFQVRAVLQDDFDGVQRWYSVRTDIHDRRMAEEALRQSEAFLRDLQARMARAAQVATVGELAGSIAHEVSQPLAAVVANAHACVRWLSASPPNVSKAVEAAERIVKDGKDAGEVVRRVRALFKRATLEKAPLDLGEVIREVLRLVDSYPARTDVSLHVALDPDLPPVWADRVQVQQLLLNLLLNALEALEPVSGRVKRLSITSGRADPRQAVIRISDNGIGLDDPTAAFEPFVTTKPEGMGLGLAICRSIVAAHEGRLSAERNAGFGMTFTVVLPIQHPPEP